MAIKITKPVTKAKKSKKKSEENEECDFDGMKEFTVQITEPNGKVFVTMVKAKTKESCLNICEKDYKGKDFSFRII